MKKLIISESHFAKYLEDYKGKPSLGYGKDSIVFDYGKDKVIKFAKNRYYREAFLESIKFMKKYPKYFVKIFGVTETYVIQEKADVKKVKTMLEELFEIFKKSENSDDDSFASFWEIIEFDEEYSYPDFTKEVKKNVTLFNFLREIQNFINEVKYIFAEDNYIDIDITDNNIGYDKNGNLKFVDI